MAKGESIFDTERKKLKKASKRDKAKKMAMDSTTKKYSSKPVLGGRNKKNKAAMNAAGEY